ncbi:hypothetical protein Tco_0766305 [Tanacetum coccineum]
MAETMEKYMSKTRADYGSGVARPKIKNNDNFELKGQFLKELRTNTFSSSDHKDANEHIEKVLEIVDLFHILNITIDQVMLRAFPMSLTGAASRWLRNELTGLQEVILFYNGLGTPTRQILDSRGAIASKTTADAKIAIQEMIDVYKRKITLRVGEERIVFTSVKPTSSLVKRVYMLLLRERMELDLEARLIGETLVLNRSLDPFLEDYIELNDLNEPFELRRNQGDDLMPTIKEGEAIKEFRTRDDELNVGINDYPSYCDYDKKIHIDCAHNLKYSCMIGFEFTHANFPIIDLRSKEISMNIAGEFTNLEILKCWSLETSRRLFNTNLANKLNMENLPSKYQESFSF